jgi:serine/threonine protein kinase/Leucine-rich repeat (LRR) protein
MPVVLPCPERKAYQRLLQGELSPSEVDRLSQHLAECSSCAAAVQTLLSEDTLLSGLDAAPTDPPIIAQVPADLTRRLLALPAQSLPDRVELGVILSPAQRPDEIGRVAHYRVLKVLGEGGMGIVFLAEDVRLARPVALKTMKPALAADSALRQRFIREARAAAKVEDPHIVPIYDVGEERGVPWLAMPFLKGQSLAELLKQVKRLDSVLAIRLGVQVARGLAAAHAVGLIHRDVKPANIWVEPEGGGRAKLLDFGLARDQTPLREPGDTTLTRTGAVLGTPAYMAPEQARGELLDARADLFSLGCVLYRAVTGRVPFQGSGMMGTLVALATQTPPAPHEVNPEVPRALSTLILSLLAKERSARPASATLVAETLEPLLEKPIKSSTVVLPPVALQEVSAASKPAIRSSRASARRRLWPLATTAAMLLAVGGALATGIVVIIKDPNGKVVASLKVPEGGSFETTKDEDSGKTKGGSAESSKGDPVVTNPDREAAKWALSVGATITIRQDGKPRMITNARDLPTTPFELIGLNLASAKSKADDASLIHLVGLTHLTYLDLANSVVGDAGLQHLKGLTSLETLLLGHTQVGDAGLEHLKRLTNLTRLTLGSTHVTDSGLAHLEGLTKLTDLRLPYTKLTDAGMVHLKGLKSLTDLYLANTPIANAGLEHLKGMNNLERLWLNDTKVTDSGLEHLKGLTHLKVLNLSITRVNGSGLVYLKGLPDLTNLVLEYTRVGDAGLDHLKEFPSLTNLDLKDAPVTDKGLEQLEGMTKLEYLDLGGTRITNEGLAHIKGLTNLTELGLYRTRVSDAGLVHLKGMTKLVELRLDHTRVAGPGLKHLANVPLQHLWVDYARLSPGAFAVVRKDFPNLQIEGEHRLTLAEDLLNEGVTLLIRTDEAREDRTVKKIADLPSEPFVVRRLDCTGVKKSLHGLLIRMGNPRESEFDRIEAIDVSGCTISGLGFAGSQENLRELNASDTKIAELQPLLGGKSLRKLLLDRTAVSDLGPIAEMPNLEELSLSGTRVTDTTLKVLESLPNLRKLDLHQTAVTERALGYLGKLSTLTDLSLAGCNVNDAGLKQLTGLSHLTQLDLSGTHITADGVATLKKALPKCKIVSDPIPH